MKYLNLLSIAILLSACYHSGEKTISGNKVDLKAMNDSIIQLIVKFQQFKDSTALKAALSLNDKVIALDSAKKNQYYNLNTRIQILGLLNKRKEAFLLKEKILSKEDLNIDRLIYYGQKYKLMGLKDSSDIYFNSALEQCDKLLKDAFNFNLIIQKVEIYTFQKRYDDALRTIEQGLLKEPQNDILNTLKDDFDEYIKRTNNLFNDIKLQ